jgi:hypothetical protein
VEEMLDAKSGRKRAEGDFTTSANRIALLRMEDSNEQQRINETKTRAVEILEIKRRNEKENSIDRVSIVLQRETVS